MLYDHFTPYVLMQLEELGFCGRGEAPGFIADGAIEIGGRLPLNTHGGQLGEAYIHGMNGIAEAVRQVRGTSVNQVPDAEHVLVTAGTGVPTSGLILSSPSAPTGGSGCRYDADRAVSGCLEYAERVWCSQYADGQPRTESAERSFEHTLPGRRSRPGVRRLPARRRTTAELPGRRATANQNPPSAQAETSANRGPDPR